MGFVRLVREMGFVRLDWRRLWHGSIVQFRRGRDGQAIGPNQTRHVSTRRARGGRERSNSGHQPYW